MKIVFTALLYLVFFQTNAQSFYKGALVGYVNYGIDIYKVKQHSVYKGALAMGNTTKDTTDAAGCTGLRLGAEYGVLGWLGLGLSGKINNYITSKDTATGVKPNATGGEIGALINFHILRKEKFNLTAGFDVGYSHITYRSHDTKGTEIYGDGSWFNIRINPRYYFGRFGINMILNFPFISYPKLVSSDATFNANYDYSWKASGWGLNFGIQYRFLNSR